MEMHFWFKFSGFAWDVFTARRFPWSASTWVANLLGLGILWRCLAPAAAGIGDPRVMIVGGWAVSMAVAGIVYCQVPQIKVLRWLGNLFGWRLVALVPFVVALSLIPCAVFQRLVCTEPAVLLPFLLKEWQLCAAMSVVDLLCSV
jgi:hypothetical protein